MKDLIESIKENEGFVGHVYPDSLGIDTIGYGTKMPLTKNEAELILEHRLSAKIRHLVKEKPFVINLPDEKQMVLYEMSYQMGVNGVLKFKKMWRAIKSNDFNEASLQMLNSKWAEQTPERAFELARIMKK